MSLQFATTNYVLYIFAYHLQMQAYFRVFGVIFIPDSQLFHITQSTKIYQQTHKAWLRCLVYHSECSVIMLSLSQNCPVHSLVHSSIHFLSASYSCFITSYSVKGFLSALITWLCHNHYMWKMCLLLQDRVCDPWSAGKIVCSASLFDCGCLFIAISSFYC